MIEESHRTRVKILEKYANDARSAARGFAILGDHHSVKVLIDVSEMLTSAGKLEVTTSPRVRETSLRVSKH